jgi:mitotic-spindle organizing protein 1
MSSLLNTGLDRQTLAVLVQLCEHGVNPEALAAVVRELKAESDAVKE